MRTCSKDIYLMKKVFFISLLIIGLLLTPFQATAATKACPKSQLNKIKNGFVCKKVDDVYRWVQILPPTTKITPTPINTTTQTTNASNTINKFILISDSAQSTILNKINKNKLEILNTNYIISNTIQLSHVETVKNQLDTSYTYWKDYYDGKNLNIILWDYASSAWADKVYEDIKGNYNKGQKPSSAASSPEFCTNAWQSNFKENNIDKFVIISCENPTNADRLKFKMAHEYTHVVQDHVGLIQSNSSVWSIEGGAHYYGQVIGFNGNKNLINQNRKDFLYTLKYYFDKNQLQYNFLNIKKIDFISHMKVLESRSADEPKIMSAYLLGSIATEYLIGSFGEAKLLEFWKEHKQNNNTSSAFNKVYGYSIDIFYEELYEYYIFHLKDFSYGN